MQILPPRRKLDSLRSTAREVNYSRRQTIFRQPNLPKLPNLLYNKAVLIFITMAGMRMATLAAGLGAAMAGGPDEASAQTSEVMLPHPDGELVIDVTRVALDTQAEILETLRACLQEEYEASDENENGSLEPGDEVEFFEEGQAFCAESAERQFTIATNEARITASQARMDAVGDAIIRDLQSGS